MYNAKWTDKVRKNTVTLLQCAGVGLAMQYPCVLPTMRYSVIGHQVFHDKSVAMNKKVFNKEPEYNENANNCKYFGDSNQEFLSGAIPALAPPWSESNPEAPSEPGVAAFCTAAGCAADTLIPTDTGAPLAPAHSAALGHLGTPAPAPAPFCEIAARFERPLKLESFVYNCADIYWVRRKAAGPNLRQLVADADCLSHHRRDYLVVYHLHSLLHNFLTYLNYLSYQRRADLEPPKSTPAPTPTFKPIPAPPKTPKMAKAERALINCKYFSNYGQEFSRGRHCVVFNVIMGHSMKKNDFPEYTTRSAPFEKSDRHQPKVNAPFLAG
uniref:Uncharacterized protein n=1 Tax=Glossina palpalis gambiensis TaxID=67801 RepID=A0A1B0AU41_9MUSC